MRRLLLAIAAVALIATACTFGTSAGTPTMVVTSAALPPGVSISACTREPQDRCGTIRVPLHREGSAPGTITVHFRVLEHTDASADVREPIVAFEGGPGYGSTSSATSYRFMLGPLLATHDLILMDQRGTGASGAIDCRELQRQIGNYETAAADCARELGDSANAYGSAAAADDMAAILDALDVWRVDVYGDSYGSYLAQVFALRHPDRTRAVVLDGTFDDSFDPLARDAAASLRNAWATLCRRAGTCPGILGNIRRFEQQLQARPLVGNARDADGTWHHVRLTAPGLAQLLYDATYSFTIYRDFPAALAALSAGDDVPMLRLAAEDLPSTSPGGDVHVYSEGAYIAVSCHDYPLVWDRAQSVADRTRQLDQVLDGLSPHAFAPFSNGAWLDSLYEYELVYGCLRWPAPDATDHTELPTRLPHPDTPVLVLNGGSDVTTPPSDARTAAAAWPNATYVLFANEIHVTAIGDYERCSSTIARRFIRTLHAGDTACAAKTPRIHVVSAFPRSVRDAPQAGRGRGDRSEPADRKVAWVVGETVGDALSHWWSLMYGAVGHGLRGGTFTVKGGYYTYANPLVLTLNRVRFTDDVAVSGTVTWLRRAATVVADLQVESPADPGHVWLVFGTNRFARGATIRGTLGGRPISLRLGQLWST